MSAVLAATAATPSLKNVSSHTLSAPALEQAGKLMAFNWMVAAYAHPDWLGPWAQLLEPRDQVDMRLLRRASVALLERHHLQDRYLSRPGEHAWLLMPPEAIHPVAHELGVAMLGGWVRTNLERAEVALQLRVLPQPRRAQALKYASTLHALPYCTRREGWPVSRLEPSAVFELGVSCMAALLDDERTGCRERFTMRFAGGVVVPLALTPAQREEALRLIHEQLGLSYRTQPTALLQRVPA